MRLFVGGALFILCRCRCNYTFDFVKYAKAIMENSTLCNMIKVIFPTKYYKIVWQQ